MLSRRDLFKGLFGGLVALVVPEWVDEKSMSCGGVIDSHPPILLGVSNPPERVVVTPLTPIKCPIKVHWVEPDEESILLENMATFLNSFDCKFEAHVTKRCDGIS